MMVIMAGIEEQEEKEEEFCVNKLVNRMST